MLQLQDTAIQKPMQKRLPSLDGLRSICIILVLGEHSVVTDGFPQSYNGIFYWLFDSNMGVQFLFLY